jgi:hypothetical protein
MPEEIKTESTFEALLRIRKELKVPKGQWNKFSEFYYRSCEDILEAVKPLLENCLLTLNDEMVQIGDRYYVKATASIQSLGFSPMEAIAFAREPLAKKGMDEAQITGATSSYARKYALNGLFAIDDNKDADTKNNEKKPVNNEKLLSADELKALAPILQKINNSKTIEEIEKVGAEIKADSEAKKYKETQIKVLRSAYDGKKKKLK